MSRSSRPEEMARRLAREFGLLCPVRELHELAGRLGCWHVAARAMWVRHGGNQPLEAITAGAVEEALRNLALAEAA